MKTFAEHSSSVKVSFTYFVFGVCMSVLLWQGFHWPWNSGNFIDGHGIMKCIIQLVWLLFFFCWKKDENTHLLHVITKLWWKGVGVGEEETTKNYIKLVLAPPMDHGIMWNTVRESIEFYFWNKVGVNHLRLHK